MRILTVAVTGCPVAGAVGEKLTLDAIKGLSRIDKFILRTIEPSADLG